MVRLAFMCHADTAVITRNGAFFEGEPDFCAKQQCGGSDTILECSKKHEVSKEKQFAGDPEALFVKKIKAEFSWE